MINTDFSIGLKANTPAAVIFSNGGQQAQHTLLYQILAVTTSEKVWPGAGPHKANIPFSQGLLRSALPFHGQSLQLFISHCGI
jgi:hypothetical protein